MLNTSPSVVERDAKGRLRPKVGPYNIPGTT
jgi:hypothetical protein